MQVARNLTLGVGFQEPKLGISKWILKGNSQAPEAGAGGGGERRRRKLHAGHHTEGQAAGPALRERTQGLPRIPSSPHPPIFQLFSLCSLFPSVWQRQCYFSLEQRHMTNTWKCGNLDLFVIATD